MTEHRVVSSQEWLVARKELLAREKEFTRLRDELTAQRRALPWERVEKEYVFEGPEGRETLSDLFCGRSQLIVYHFMYGLEWKEGCKACSFLADHYNPAVVHLENRDVTLVTVSRAALSTLEAFKKRMGWSFKWVSSLESDFNLDYHVSFPEGQKEVRYNYETRSFPSSEAPGISVFVRDTAGEIFHTYSAFARGLDMFLSAYHLLDIVPNGRDEAGLTYPMEWIRHRDRYDDATVEDPFKEALQARQEDDGDDLT